MGNLQILGLMTEVPKNVVFWNKPYSSFTIAQASPSGPYYCNSRYRSTNRWKELFNTEFCWYSGIIALKYVFTTTLLSFIQQEKLVLMSISLSLRLLRRQPKALYVCPFDGHQVPKTHLRPDARRNRHPNRSAACGLWKTIQRTARRAIGSAGHPKSAFYQFSINQYCLRCW